MAIQWYPGHMAKARRAIAEAVPTCDVVIEVLDARMPRSSENPVLGELRGQKPCLKVLSKIDLADPEITRAWLSALAKPAGPRSAEVAALAITTQKNGDTLSRVPAACARLATRPNLDNRPVRAPVVGIPNVVPSAAVAVWASVAVMVMGIIVTAIEGWRPVSGPEAGHLAAASLALVVGYMLSVMVMRVGDIGLIAPFRYTALLWAILFGWLLFGTLPDGWTVVGAAIVVATGIYTLLRERNLRRRAAVAGCRNCMTWVQRL